MKRRKWLAALWAALLLLTGCAPGPATEAEAPPPATSAPVGTQTLAGVDFSAFLEEANAARRAVLEDGPDLDLSPWTADFRDQNDTFTPEEMDRLTAPPEALPPLSRAGMEEDVETLFTLLRTTYGAYTYFGGDEVFLPLKDAVRSDLEGERYLLSRDLEKVLVRHLAPVLVDGHFTLGSTAMRDGHAQYMYYVPGLYFSDTEGLDPAYVKPTIGPDGAIVHWFAALSHDGTDLPERQGDYELDWVRAGETPWDGLDVFTETEAEGIPVLTSRQMYARKGRPPQEEQLERFASCGGDYADESLFLFDLRANGGGSDIWIMDWFEGWAGQPAAPRRAFAHRVSQLSNRLMPEGYPADRIGTWQTADLESRWAQTDSVVLVLTDKGTASSGETAVKFFRAAGDVLFIGGPTLGCSLTPNNCNFYLPNTGLRVYFGTGLSFCESLENIDGAGFLPDLWVEPADALDAAVRLCQYYNLK